LVVRHRVVPPGLRLLPIGPPCGGRKGELGGGFGRGAGFG
jgi:hypothetical protein